MNIKDLFLEEIQDYFCSFGLPKFRAEQVFSWVYQKQICDWDQMTDLPKELRQFFRDKGLTLSSLQPKAQTQDIDGTIKFLFELEDKQLVESVFIPECDRQTVCVSTQVGCGMGCSFCATGRHGLVRNLTVAEIVDQPLSISRITGSKINNLVIMGQGEPLVNYDSTLKAIKLINNPKGIGMGARHITISTCGIIPGIHRLAMEPLQVNLAISLHAASDEIRTRMMPIAVSYPLVELMAAIREYIEKTNRRVTFEYVMIDGVNDRPQDLHGLIKLLAGLLCHVNLIPLNPVVEHSRGQSNFRRSKPASIRNFVLGLTEAHIETTVRKERGTNLAAACGQLQGNLRSKNELDK